MSVPKIDIYTANSFFEILKFQIFNDPRSGDIFASGFRMKKYILWTLTLCTYHSLVHAQVDPSWVIKDPAVFAEAKAITKPLKRDVIVYSWAPRQYIGNGFPAKGGVDSISPAILQSVETNVHDRMSRFWDISVPVSGRSLDGGAMAPNGFYVATEPVISRNYGGANWAVYQMILPAGMTFIDGRYRTGTVLGPHLQKALAARGCTNPLRVDSKNPVFATRNLIKADTQQTACRQALMDIANAVNAKAVLYFFLEEPVPTCRKVYQWNAAFVLIRPEAYKPNTLRALVQDRVNQEDGLEPSRQLINAVFKDAGKAGPFSNSSTASEAETAKFMKDNYFACNPEIREW